MEESAHNMQSENIGSIIYDSGDAENIKPPGRLLFTRPLHIP